MRHDAVGFDTRDNRKAGEMCEERQMGKISLISRGGRYVSCAGQPMAAELAEKPHDDAKH